MAAGNGCPSGRPRFQKVPFRAKNSLFFAQNRPRTHSKQPNEGKWWLHACNYMQLAFPVSKSSLGSSNSTICVRNAPKWPPKPPKFAHIGHCQLQTKNSLYLGLRGSKRDFEGTQSSRNHPLLVVSNPQKCPNGRLDPHTWAHWAASCRRKPKQVGAKTGQQRPLGAKKITFFNTDRRPHWMPNKCFWHVLSLWWPVLTLRKYQNALKMGRFGTKNGSKMRFSNNYSRAFEVHKKVK